MDIHDPRESVRHKKFDKTRGTYAHHRGRLSLRLKVQPLRPLSSYDVRRCWKRVFQSDYIMD